MSLLFDALQRDASPAAGPAPVPVTSTRRRRGLVFGLVLLLLLGGGGLLWWLMPPAADRPLDSAGGLVESVVPVPVPVPVASESSLPELPPLPTDLAQLQEWLQTMPGTLPAAAPTTPASESAALPPLPPDLGMTGEPAFTLSSRNQPGAVALQRAYQALARAEYAVAAAGFAEAVQQGNQHAVTRRAEAVARLRANQPAAAISLLQEILRHDPTDRSAALALAAALADRAAPGDLELFAELMVRQPRVAGLYAEQARLFDRLGSPEQARAALRTALALAPGNLRYLFNLAVLADRAGEATTARRLYGELLRRAPAADFSLPLAGIEARVRFLENSR